MNKVAFLIDGFNLYHSVRGAARQLQVNSVKWLDIASLCSSYLYLFGKDAVLADIIYFSALANHLDPGKVQRHEIFIKCLQNTGVQIELASFKRKTIKCPYCRRNITRYEEKETDVGISVKLVELFYRNLCDTVVLMTGDTDVVPAIKLAKELFPDKQIGCAFPYNRKNFKISQNVDQHFKISAKQYLNHQFPDSLTINDGTTITKPPNW